MIWVKQTPFLVGVKRLTPICPQKKKCGNSGFCSGWSWRIEGWDGGFDGNLACMA